METTPDQNLKPAKLFFTTYCPLDTDYENRSPIILLHGIGATSGTWKGIKEAIGKKTKRKVICIDLRNHGKSEWPDEISLEHIMVDIENFMLEQKIPKAILLGHSFGGRGALGLAFERPELIEKLILEDVFLHVTDVWLDLLRNAWLMTDLIKRLPKTLSLDEAQKLVAKHCKTLFPDVEKACSDKKIPLIQFYKDKKTGSFKCFFDLDAKNKLGNIEFDLSTNPSYSGKTLVMTAENSSCIPMNEVEELRSYLPNSSVAYIARGSHALHLENPTQFIEVTTKFINDD